MDEQIKRWEGKSFSGEDIHRLCEGKVRVLRYRDLKAARTLSEAMGKHKALILLYETSEGYGHWVAVFEAGPDTIEVFDSYGLMFDDELDFVDPEFRKQSGQLPFLTRLLMRSGYPNIIFNQERLQRLKSDVNTCGRWCGLRVCLRHLPLREFIALFRKQRMPADWYVTALTIFV
jgi:hypothetical protein